MSNQIGNSGHPLVNSSAFAGADIAATAKGRHADAASGQFQGRRVNPAPSALAIADEMSQDADLEADIESETMGEEIRKLSERRGAGDSESVDGEDEHASEASGDVAKPPVKSLVSEEKMHLFLAGLRERQPKSHDEVLDEARKYFADVTDQHEALEKAEKLLAGSSGESDLAGEVKQARETLYRQQGPAIRAGLNVAAEVEEFAKSGLASADELREFYRKSVLDFENVADLFGKIVKLYGKEKFKEALTFLLRAGGNDMASQGPSVAVGQLKSVTDQLYDVEVLGNLHRSLDDLLDRVKKLFGEAENGDSFEMMSKLLDLTQARWMNADSITKVTVDAKVSGVEAVIYFLTSLKEIVRLIPLKIYTNPENRGKMIDATQEALDQAIDQDV